MKNQILFSGENKENISICHPLKLLPIVLSVKARNEEDCSSTSVHLISAYISHQQPEKHK